MLNTGMGDANVITTIRNTMQLVEQRPEANDAKLRGVL
jgi:hypothetical protein